MHKLPPKKESSKRKTLQQIGAHRDCHAKDRNRTDTHRTVAPCWPALVSYFVPALQPPKSTACPRRRFGQAAGMPRTHHGRSASSRFGASNKFERKFSSPPQLSHAVKFPPLSMNSTLCEHALPPLPQRTAQTRKEKPACLRSWPGVGPCCG